jgi:hypothetical protein
MASLASMQTGGIASMVSKPQGLIGMAADQFKSKKKSPAASTIAGGAYGESTGDSKRKQLGAGA